MLLHGTALFWLSFPSVFGHSSNIQQEWQHLSTSNREKVPMHHRRVAESLSLTYTWTSNEFYLESVLIKCDSFHFIAFSWHWSILMSLFVGITLKWKLRSFRRGWIFYIIHDEGKKVVSCVNDSDLIFCVIAMFCGNNLIIIEVLLSLLCVTLNFL